MPKTKEILLTAFALFSLFYGAGNLILPPMLGLKSGSQWNVVTFGFCLSAVVIPILGIMAHAKLQGTLYDFGKKVSPTFSTVYAYIIYLISISLPAPRTASVTYEMAIQPLLDISSLLTSTIYFLLVFLLVINRATLLNTVGKWLTPGILIILTIMVLIAITGFSPSYKDSIVTGAFSIGLIEGYQTFDAIGSIVVGGVIIVSVSLGKKQASYTEKKKLIQKAAWLSGTALFLAYAGLVYTGAIFQSSFNTDIARTELLNQIALKTLGNNGQFLLSLLVSLACFTTAVGIVTGTADFVQSRFSGSRKAFTLTAFLGCVIGVAVGQMNVSYIINLAVPALMLLYPLTIALIVLNIIPTKYASPVVFRVVVFITLLFSFPDFLESLGFDVPWYYNLPLAREHVAWLIPAITAFIGCNVYLIYFQKQNNT